MPEDSIISISDNCSHVSAGCSSCGILPDRLSSLCLLTNLHIVRATSGDKLGTTAASRKQENLGNPKFPEVEFRFSSFQMSGHVHLCDFDAADGISRELLDENPGHVIIKKHWRLLTPSHLHLLDADIHLHGKELRFGDQTLLNPP